jgi:bacterioferritin
MATTTAKRSQQAIELLQKAYMMELETVTNYLANSVHLEGVHAEEIKKALAADITEELGHATQIAKRIKQLGGRVPGSLELKFDQEALQPPDDTTNLRAVMEGVLHAENAAIEHYQTVIKATEGKDYVTQDLAIKLLGDEEAHREQFESFLAGYGEFEA